MIRNGDWKISLQGLFLFSLFYLCPVFDAFSGYLVLSKVFSESFIGSPSQLIRALIFILSLRFISYTDWYKLLAFFLFFVTVEVIAFLSYMQVMGFITAMVFTYKLLYPIAIFFALKNLIKKDLLSLNKLKVQFFNSGFLYSIGVLVPFVLGVGFSTYTEGAFGTKGFFASGNGLGMFLGIISVLGFHEKIYNRSWFYLLKYLCVVISLLLVGTKAAMIFLIIVLVLYFKSLRLFYKFALIIVLTLMLINFHLILLNAFSVVYDVIVLRFNKSESVWSFIFSGRDDAVQYAFNEFRTNGLLFYRNIIGGGSFMSFRDPEGFVPAFDTLETDFFDVFFMYGVLGLIIYCMIIFAGFYEAFKKKFWALLFFFLIVILHSAVAGHVLFNGMSILGVVLLLLYIYHQPRIQSKITE